MAKDYYEMLGVDRSATKEDIRRAYKRLAKKYHPDLNKDPGAADKFKEINEAAAVLGDDKRREQYDRFGTTAENFNGFQGFDFSNFGGFGGFEGFEDIFESFFGSSFGGRPRRQRRGGDLSFDLEIDLAEAAFGATRRVVVPRMEACASCSGTGAQRGSDVASCPTCGGTGHVKRTTRTPFGLFSTSTICQECRGEGQVIRNKCRTCHGSGRVTRERRIEVNIPAGIESGSSLRIDGEGEVGPRGAPPGDLYLNIHIREDDKFERKGSDIYTDIPISFVQAALGDEIEVPTLKGKARLTIPAGTQTNTLFRLKGEGISKLRGFGRGDEYIRVIVQTPQKLTSRTREALMEYARLSKEDVSLQKGFFSRLREML